MAKVKYTKNALREQRDALARFRRFLPTLKLKKEQLQGEVRRLALELQEKREALRLLEDEISAWLGVVMDEFPLARYAEVAALETRLHNVVGVSIPVLQEVRFARSAPDPYASPAWADDAVEALQARVRMRIEVDFLSRQRDRLADELRTTTQRVNLFEKVKIPETLDNIRRIRIFLGDQQTAAVARAKLTKSKSAEQWRSA